MDNINIIIKPLVTEKGTHLQTTRNVYAFKVHHEANKGQIKHAVETLYNVKVLDVHTMNRKGKPRRARNAVAHASNWKRALVKLEENSHIDLF